MLVSLCFAMKIVVSHYKGEEDHLNLSLKQTHAKFKIQPISSQISTRRLTFLRRLFLRHKGGDTSAALITLFGTLSWSKAPFLPEGGLRPKASPWLQQIRLDLRRLPGGAPRDTLQARRGTAAR